MSHQDQTAHFKVGDVARVTPQYVGSGRYQNDHWTGLLVKLLRPVGGSTFDCTTNLDETRTSEWQVNLHVSRLTHPGID